MSDENDKDINQDEESKEKKDDVDWKAKYLEQQGINKRLKTKLEKKADDSENSKEEAPDKKEEKQSGEFDYGQLAYMETKGIKTDEEFEFVQKIMERTGDELKDVVNDDYVKGKLKEIREKQVVKKATPSNSKRAATSRKDEVDYWLNKGELPPLEQQELRRKVVNAKIIRAKGGTHFSSNPISGRVKVQ